MRKLIYIIIVLFIYSFNGCTKSDIQISNISDVLLGLKSNAHTGQIRSFYTKETLDLLDKFGKKSGLEEDVLLDILSIIPERAGYEIQSKSEDKIKASVSFIFTDGVSENIKALKIDLLLKKENNSWKIDRSVDFKKMLASHGKNGAETYFKR